MVNPLDAADLAETMMRFINDNDTLVKLRDAGLKQANKFNWETCASETMKTYTEILENKQGQIFSFTDSFI